MGLVESISTVSSSYLCPLYNIGYLSLWGLSLIFHYLWNHAIFQLSYRKYFLFSRKVCDLLRLKIIINHQLLF